MNDPARALRYLLARSFVNRARAQLSRIRSPRYAVAVAMGLLYLWFVLGNRGNSYGVPTTGGAWVPPGFYEALLALSIAWTWLFGEPEPALTFNNAEVQLLFPAPLSRRALVHYKLVQAQVPILISVLVWKIVLQRTTLANTPLRAIALWVLFTTLYLHRVGASLVRVAATQHGRKGLRRNLPALLIAGTVIAAVLWTVVRAYPALAAAARGGTLLDALLVLRQTPVIRTVLWPLHVLVAPATSVAPGVWTANIGWGILLLALNYVWVVRAGVAFEEAAMRRAERVAAMRAARSTGALRGVRASRGWLPLRARGNPAIAIAWKNVVAFQRLLRIPRIAFITLLVVGVPVAVLPTNQPLLTIIRVAALAFAAIFVMLGPLYVRTDLHLDMLKLPLLRSYPLTGAQVVGAEIAGVVAILCTLQLGLLIVGFPFLVLVADITHALPIAAAGLFAIPAVTALRVAVANAWVVLLPGWVHLGPGRAAGIEAMGQNLLSVLGSFVAHALLLVLPAIAAASVWGLTNAWLNAWALVPAGVAGAAAAYAELSALVTWLGGILAATDPAAVETDGG